MKKQFDNGTDFIRTKTVLSPSAQINTMYAIGELETVNSSEYEKKIELLKPLYYDIYVIANLQYSYGLRISEVLNIRYSDITKGHRLIIHGLKGSDSKIIDVSKFKDVFVYLGKNTSFVFSHIDRFFVYRVFKKFGLTFQSKSSSRQSVTHSLRHQFVNELRSEGVDSLIIQKSIGHKNAKNTEIYGNKKA